MALLTNSGTAVALFSNPAVIRRTLRVGAGRCEPESVGTRGEGTTE
jgi:hypothetical protein